MLVESLLDPTDTLVDVVIPVSEKFLSPVGCIIPFTLDLIVSYVWLLLIVYDKFW